MTAHPGSEVLVGREADLAALRDALKRTRSAEPSTVLVGGEAGVGKTRLVEEFRRAAEADGARVLTGQALELGEEGLPFAPFAAALRALVHADGPGVLDGREREFARLLPELGTPPDPDEVRRGYLFDLVAALFARLSEAQPLVLVLEDLHWADRSTRDLIGFLVRSARLPHVLLLVTYRTDELQRGHPLRAFLAELDRVRGVARLDLERLDREATAAMLTQLLGAEPEPRTVDSVHERAQGNPFFIEQFALTGDPACADIPHSLRDLLLTRVDQLPEVAQRVLRVAAVGGTRFGHELLTRVAGLGEAELESALRAVVAAQLIVVESDGGYEFRHALVREAVHDDLLPGEHARLHSRYAQAIEAEPHLVAMGRAPAEIAHHWHAAHDPPRALVAAKQAADHAGRRYAYAEQARLLERVLELWEQVPDPRDRLGAEHHEVLEDTALATIEAGDHKRALKLIRAALADVGAAADPLRRARLLVRLSKLLHNAGSGDGVAEAREAYELLRTVPTTRERVVLLAAVARALTSERAEDAARVAQEAMTLAAEVGDGATEASVLITYGQVCAGVLPTEQGLAAMLEAADQARATGHLPNLANALVNASDALFRLGRYAESAETAAEGVPYANRIGVTRTTGVFLLANYAEALIALGRWDSADARLAEAARTDPPGTLALPWMRLRARLRLARGHDGAQSLVERAVGFLSRPFLIDDNRLSLHDLRIVAALHAGDVPAAADAARTALAETDPAARPRYGWPLLATAAEAADRAAADDLAARFREAAAEASDRAAGNKQSAGVRGAAEAADRAAGNEPPAGVREASDRAVGNELAARVREVAAKVPVRRPADRAYAAQVHAALDRDPAAWRTAVDEWRADGQRYPLALALRGLAECAAGAGDRQTAADAIDEATAIAAALGAKPLTDQLATLAQRLGLRSTAPATEGTEVLTSREREVLRLVAEGHSNGRIAERLYISPKTASVHVSRIIAKLGVANRVEAAAVAHRLGLLDRP